MSSFSQALVRSLLATLGGLLLGCVLVAALAGLYFQATDPEPFTSVSTGWAASALVSAFALAYGVFPALMVGAPLYALLLRHGWANFLSAVCVGILPGLALLAFEQNFAFLFLAYGASVAACTHFVASKLRSWPRVAAG
jgi:hypothetical protein